MSGARPRRGALAAALAAATIVIACRTAPPEGVTPVARLDLERYAGRWYEIARLDHRFERGLTDVRATYTLRPDGTIAVVNEGWDPEAARWRRAEGTARPRGAHGDGSLEVSFFGPFWGGYHVLAIDPDYAHALVAGPSRDYLWILAREPRIAPATRDALLDRARALGFAVDELRWVEHGRASVTSRTR